MDIIQKIKEELQVEKWQVEAAVKLIDEGNTIPFISRYRKEATGSLNDEQLRNLGSPDAGSSRGSVPPLSSQEKDPCQYCKGEGSGTSGRIYSAPGGNRTGA